MPTPKLLDQVRIVARLKHYSLSTERAYVGWIRRFILFHHKQHPKDLAENEIRQFLSHLAVDTKVSASTQTVALSALLFLYRDVLKTELRYVDHIERARASQKLPVVFTRREVQAVLSRLDGSHHLIASLLYGSGLLTIKYATLKELRELSIPKPSRANCLTGWHWAYNSRVGKAVVWKQVLGYIVAVIVIAAATAVLQVFGGHINPTTVALAFLLIVLFVAAAWGSKPAVLAALAGGISFNVFFLPPVGTLHISEPENWIAFLSFLVTGITAGQLSARARRRAEEANAARRETENLYRELQDTFEQASQAKAIKQSERLKSALLDAVTHDLRTPLTSIKASVTTLLDDRRAKLSAEETIHLDEAERTEMLEVIDEESDRLDRFISGMMELARIDAGEMQLRRDWGSIEEIVSEALARAQPLTKNHAVEVKIESDLPSLRVDGRAVSEVVYSLVDNAAKYSPAGTRICIGAQRSGDERIQMSVEDQGKGIGVELRDRVFDKFFRATRDGDVSTSRVPGNGMGLAIAKGIVEAHDGTIRIESGIGGNGTRVIFTLPIGAKKHVNSGSAGAPAMVN